MRSESAVSYDAIILGGGAAGLFCALTAGARGRRVLVLEHNEHVGKKIAISGGGRCNFTNFGTSPENYLSSNPDFCRSALARFTPADFLALVEKHGIAWHEKKLGQLFCNGSSREIIAMLLEECARVRVAVRCGVHIHEVAKPEKFIVRTSHGEVASDALVVATGGLSFAKLGATGFGYDTARHFGLRILDTRPGLVPLTLGGEEKASFGPLSGVSLPVRARCGKAVFDEAMLITHRGLSGPAILQISSFRHEDAVIELDLLPARESVLVPGRGAAAEQLAHVWPRSFADAWCRRYAPSKTVAQWTAAERDRVKYLLHHWSPNFSGTEGYPKAEVTLGGVDTHGLSSKTMEARHLPGLFFIGEVLDVTGWLGGYNFQWAWASAHAAGTAL